MPTIQLFDIAPVDLFGMLSQDYLRACNLPSSIVSTGFLPSQLRITYISPLGADSHTATTASLDLRNNVGLDDESVGPGKLDILFIPGPPPTDVPDEKMCAFVWRHFQAGVDLMTACTGVFVAGHAGVLDGKRATGPRELIGMMLKKKFGNVLWEEKRWTQDGNLWTSGKSWRGVVGTDRREVLIHLTRREYKRQ